MTNFMILYALKYLWSGWS